MSATEGRKLGIWVCLVVLIVLHLLLAGQIAVCGAAPGFLACATCVVALHDGERNGVVVGFALGLLFDLTGSGPVGLSPLLGSVLGYGLGRAGRGDLAKDWRRSSAACGAALLAYNLAYPLFLLAFGDSLDLGWSLVGRVVAGAACDTIICAASLCLLSRGKSPRASGGLRLR